MIKKFNCKNCNKSFDTDNQDSVICPYCHSDNVEPVSNHIPAIVWKFLISAIVVMLACCVILIFPSRCGSTMELAPNEVDSINFSDIEEPPTVIVEQPVFNDNGKYSVDVRGDYLPHGIKFYYVMLSHFEHKVLQKCEDGHFKNIPYCEEDGHSYDFAIMDAKADTLLCTPMPVTGFIRQVCVSEKMTVNALQSLIDKRDPSLNGAGENDYLSPNYTIKFKGLPSDAVNVPSILAEVTEKLDMDAWQQVTVTNLEYDDMNRISVIFLNVKVSDY